MRMVPQGGARRPDLAPPRTPPPPPRWLRQEEPTGPAKRRVMERGGGEAP